MIITINEEQLLSWYPLPFFACTTDFSCVISASSNPLQCAGSWLGCQDLQTLGVVSIWDLTTDSVSSWMSSGTHPPHCYSQLKISKFAWLYGLGFKF